MGHTGTHVAETQSGQVSGVHLVVALAERGARQDGARSLNLDSLICGDCFTGVFILLNDWNQWPLVGWIEVVVAEGSFIWHRSSGQCFEVIRGRAIEVSASSADQVLHGVWSEDDGGGISVVHHSQL